MSQEPGEARGIHTFSPRAAAALAVACVGGAAVLSAVCMWDWGYNDLKLEKNIRSIALFFVGAPLTFSGCFLLLRELPGQTDMRGEQAHAEREVEREIASGRY